jgi:hypothetical protein
MMRQGFRAYLEYLGRYDSPAARLCDAGVPARVVHAEKGDGALTDEERRTLEACPRDNRGHHPRHQLLHPERRT